jgi:hypothetical protein
VAVVAALVLAPAWVLAEPSAPAPKVIALDEVMSLPAKVADAHDRLRAKLTEALGAKGWTAVPARATGQCHDSAHCPIAALSPGPVRYVLRMSGATNEDDGYDFLLELGAPDGAATQKRAAFCNYCDVDRMDEVAASFAVDLLAGAVPRGLPSPQPPAQARVPLGPTITAQPVARPSADRRTAWLPWLLVGGGAAAAGYGAWAIHRDGMTDSCQPSAVATTCTRYSSGTVGVVGITAGAVLVVSGVVWALWLEHTKKSARTAITTR